MCNIWKTYRDNPSLASEELTISEFRGLFSDREFFRALEFVYLSGGEPFLRADLAQIISCIDELKPRCLIYVATNGFLTDHVVATVGKILAFHPRFQVGISLDGIGEAHDQMRRVAGAFGKTCKTIRALRKNFPQLHIQGTMTITPKNFRQIPMVYDFCKRNGLFPQVSLATRSPYFLGSDEKLDYSSAAVEEIRGYFDAIRRDLIRSPGRYRSLSQLYWIDGILQHLLNPAKHLVPCYSGCASAYINAYGTVYPCYSFLEELGNIRKDTLRSIWSSKKAREIRTRISDKECPNCWIAHEASISIKYDYLRKFRYMLR
jgi:MoaA/NifB/PqqE/SkfB family radical SAM enzyme